jgi:hypothetical protein
MSIVLSVTLLAETTQNGRTFKDVFAPTLIVTLMVLFSIALIGLRSLIHLHRVQRQRAAIQSVMALFLVMSLGVGTLTWAATAHYGKGQPVPRESSSLSRPSSSDLSEEPQK